MYDKVEICPICDNKEFRNEIICKDHSISQESFAIVSCEKCNLWMTSPRPSVSQIGKYYESEEYISHTSKPNTIINWLYLLVRNITLRSKLKIISNYTKNKQILDYGCGTGDFLAYCSDKNYKVRGIEPNEKARKTAQKKVKGQIYSEIKEVEIDEKMSVITLWHVLEHIHNPNEILTELRKCLKKDGIIVVAVPNRNSPDALKYKENWAAYDVPRHLFHYRLKDIKGLAKRNKLKLVNSIPQYFDSFYVSMLSEKYIGNNLNLLRGLTSGIKSNIRASEDKNYSSVIYILKK
jgi:2-polyprenyl-3-methyl-5-hydroxy-6-metoxy-1,4-benzoquinol methylase